MIKTKVKKELNDLPTIIFLTCNRTDWDVTKEALESILDNTTISYEFIHVDNGSEQYEYNKIRNLMEQIGKHELCKKMITYYFPWNVGIIVAYNVGMALATGKCFILYSNDAVVPKGWLKDLVDKAYSDEKIGIVGPVSISKPSYLILPKESKFDTGIMISFVVTLIKRELIKDIGNLDPRFGLAIMEDDDLCLRARLKGWKLATTNTKIKHFHSVTFKNIMTPEERAWRYEKNKQLFNSKWEGLGIRRK